MDEGRGTKRKHQEDDDVVDLTSPPSSPFKARKSATAAISSRRRTANTNQDVHDVDGDDDDSPTAAAAPPNLREIISVFDSDDEDDNNGYKGNAIHDIEGNTKTLDPLIDGYHLSVMTYTEFQKHANELFKEVDRLNKKGLFSEKLGIGVGDNGKRGPVYTSSTGLNEDPGVMKRFLTENNATLILGFIAFWEEICETNGMEIVNIWLTNYRERYENDMEQKIHESVLNFIKFGIMLKHFDNLPQGVIARVTTTMFEDMENNKVKKRFSMENKKEGHADVSFSAGNGTTVILDSFGSGNTSDWRHAVKGAEGTYTITLQLAKKGWMKTVKKAKKGGGEGKPKEG